MHGENDYQIQSIIYQIDDKNSLDSSVKPN